MDKILSVSESVSFCLVPGAGVEMNIKLGPARPKEPFPTFKYLRAQGKTCEEAIDAAVWVMFGGDDGVES